MAIETEAGSEEIWGRNFNYRLEVRMIREACVESLQEAILAQERGADRIELCSDLSQDGLTPSFDLIADVKRQLKIPVRVMIRPRGGDFIYSLEEMDMMQQTIEYCKQSGVEGVVFGMLTAQNEMDYDKITALVSFASSLKVTIHKAIDLTPDPTASIRSLLEIKGITSVLTSGGAATAMEGLETLKEMIAAAGNDIEVIVAGKVDMQNIGFLHQELSSKAYHGSRIVGE